VRANQPVNTVMTTAVFSVGPNDSIEELLNLVKSHSVHHVPVVEDSQVVGIVTSADLAKFRHFLPQLHDSAQATSGWKVSRIMQSPAVTVSEHDTARRAAELMVTHAIHGIPVVNAAGHLIGIVTTTDVMDACLRGPSDESSRTSVTSDEDVARVASVAHRTMSEGDDPHGLAAAFLRQQARLTLVEHVLHAAKRYLNAGQDEQLHRSLRLAIDRADAHDARH
jgi:CBS domain-containing protein